METTDTPLPDPTEPEAAPAAKNRRSSMWLYLLLFIVAAAVVGGGWYYCDTLGPNLAAAQLRSEIAASLPVGTPADAVAAWLAARQIRSFDIPRPGAGKRAGIGGRIPRQYGPRYAELWLEFYFDDHEKLTSFDVTVHSPDH